MSWGRYFLLGDFGQQQELHEQRAELERLRRRLRNMADSESTEAELARLSAENGEMRLCLAVLFRLLVTKGVTTTEEIQSLLRELDEVDGKTDRGFEGDVVTGKPSPKPLPEEPDNPFANLDDNQ